MVSTPVSSRQIYCIFRMIAFRIIGLRIIRTPYYSCSALSWYGRPRSTPSPCGQGASPFPGRASPGRGLSASLLGSKKQAAHCAACRLAPQVRLELTTLRLTAECSAIELLRIIRGLWRGLFASAWRSVCQLPPLLRLALGHAPASHIASASLWLLPLLRFRCPIARLPLAAPFFLMLGSGKNFRSSRSPWIPATSYSPRPFPAQYHQRLEA